VVCDHSSNADNGRVRRFLTFLLVVGQIGAARAAGLDDANAGLIAAQRGEYDEAIRLFSAALASGDLSPGNTIIAHHNRGNTYQDKGDYARAIAEYNVAIRLNPAYSEAYFSRGRARFSLGDYASAVTDFATSVKLDPTDPYAVIWLHLAHHKAGSSTSDELSRNSARFDLARWPGSVLNLYLGKVTPQQTRAQSASGDARTQRDQTCEASFYIGEYELLRMNRGAAKSLFEEAARNCSYTSDELAGAHAELARLF
jgi:lipoprotein NlpI